MARNITYDQLNEDEKVALRVAIAFYHRTRKEKTILPKLFEWEASESTYYIHYLKGADKLKEKGILDQEGNPTELAFEILPNENLRETVKDIRKEVETLNKKCAEESERCREISEELREVRQKFDFTSLYNRLKPSLSAIVQKEIERAMELFEAEDYTNSITDSYRASEILLKKVFKHIYGEEEAERVRKHENKLKKLWNDERLEKRTYSGIKLVASLFSAILWYRNKMGGHVELPETLEAARISIASLLQSIEELKRLDLLS